MEVACEYGTNGRLTVDARIRYTDRAVHMELTRPCGVSQTHLDRWKTAVGARAGYSLFADPACRDELRLPLRWIGILRGQVDVSLAAITGVHPGEETQSSCASPAPT